MSQSDQDQVAADAVVTVNITINPDGSADSTSHLEGLDKTQAGVILLDVGRDLLLQAMAAHAHHHHAEPA